MIGCVVALCVDLDDYLVQAQRRGRDWAEHARAEAERVVTTACADHGAGSVGAVPPDSWLVTLSGPAPDGLRDDAWELATRIRGRIAGSTSATASVAVSSVADGRGAAARAARQARETLAGKVLGGGGQILTARTGDVPLEPPDITRAIVGLVRRGDTARAVVRVEMWVDTLLRHGASPRDVFARCLPGLVMDVAAAVDPSRAEDGSPRWRSTLGLVSLADLVALSELHERSQVHEWLVNRFGALSRLAGPADRPGLAGRAHDLLRRRFTDDRLTLARAAAELGVSPFHLAHTLRQDSGTTFRRLLTGLRVRKALGLLGGGELPVAEVGRRCGFATTRQFRATMLREVGLSPSELRARGRAGLLGQGGDEAGDGAAEHLRQIGVGQPREDHAAQ
ncbi:AraC family transcriptional regulator [Jiangella rhizosphaerae]|uniref:AraC family transcriptional regulator n=1 Tax=Jiangella rhizosphaerae TaxID=2293569 RepID=A0A418KM23_9ACTN|nr:AraC family transcriptional regulator [Jiangella rhizosphaerae]